MELIRVTAEFLADKDVPSPRLDAELLLAHVLDTNRLQLYVDHARPIVNEELDRYRALVKRRGERVPLQILVGEAYLFDHAFATREGVFIPRPETEVLILRAQELDWSAFEAGAPSSIVEVGTGTGCIGLSLVHHWPQAKLQGFDVNPRAVELTLENARRLEVEERVVIVEGSPFESPLEIPACDLLISNPPYIAKRELGALEPEVRDHDPHEALFSGEDGLDLIRDLVTRGLEAVRPGGWIAFEHGFDQGAEAVELLVAAGWSEVRGHADLAGQDRVTVGRRPL